MQNHAKDSDSNPEDSDSDLSPQDLDSDLEHYRPYDAVTYYFSHWDDMFKKIQWTFSTYFLNSNDLLSLQYQCLFLRPGTVGTVSGSVKATRHKLTLKSLTYLQLLHASWTGVQQWRKVHVAKFKLELWFSFTQVQCEHAVTS